MKNRRLNGGRVWKSERLLSRLRYLQREFQFPFDGVTALTDVREILAPVAQKVVPRNVFRGGPTFWIKDVLDDVTALESFGDFEIRPWWPALSRAVIFAGEDDLPGTLDEYYRRAQLAYDEIVQKNFPEIAKLLGFHAVLPVRWNVTVVGRIGTDTKTSWPSLHYRWMPVASWAEAGADVNFAEKPPDFASRETLSRCPRKVTATRPTAAPPQGLDGVERHADFRWIFARWQLRRGDFGSAQCLRISGI